MLVTALIKLSVKEDQGSAFRAAMQDPIALTRANPECSRMELFANTEDPTDYLLVEEWTTIAAHHAHVADFIENGVLEAMSALSSAPPETIHYVETEED